MKLLNRDCQWSKLSFLQLWSWKDLFFLFDAIVHWNHFVSMILSLAPDTVQRIVNCAKDSNSLFHLLLQSLETNCFQSHQRLLSHFLCFYVGYFREFKKLVCMRNRITIFLFTIIILLVIKRWMISSMLLIKYLCYFFYFMSSDYDGVLNCHLVNIQNSSLNYFWSVGFLTVLANVIIIVIFFNYFLWDCSLLFIYCLLIAVISSFQSSSIMVVVVVIKLKRRNFILLWVMLYYWLT